MKQQFLPMSGSLLANKYGENSIKPSAIEPHIVGSVVSGSL